MWWAEVSAICSEANQVELLPVVVTFLGLAERSDRG